MWYVVWYLCAQCITLALLISIFVFSQLFFDSNYHLLSSDEILLPCIHYAFALQPSVFGRDVYCVTHMLVGARKSVCCETAVFWCGSQSDLKKKKKHSKFITLQIIKNVL